MQSQSDPIRFWRKRLIIGAAIGLLAAGAAFAWAMRSPTIREARPVVLAGTSDDDAIIDDVAADTPLDQSVFTVRLWNSLPPPEPPAPKTPARAKRKPRIKPPEHELIGIMNEAGVLYAALYDPRQDQLIIVTDGESIGAFTVDSITSERIVLKQNDFAHTLALREDQR